MKKTSAHSRDLFGQQEAKNRETAQPLSTRMRPRNLREFVGQQHFLEAGKLLDRLLKAKRVQSLIFYGPPGTGKTSLGRLIADEIGYYFVSLNAAASGIKELREQIEFARKQLETTGKRTILFVDELHHFSKTQQDVLLPDVEEGVVSLIGATTSNPFFALVSALISRSQIFEFKPLSKLEILQLLTAGLNDEQRGLGKYHFKINAGVLEFFAEMCDGDGRRALNGLEVAVLSMAGEQGNHQDLSLTLEIAEDSLQRKAIRYDKSGDEHYDAASAFIKSIRGSDPDAALYWMARMLEAGEDPRFIARRIVISASEDIGNADPMGLVIAISAARAVETIGLPEGRIALAQAVTYLACAKKSNASYLAIDAAIEDIKNQSLLPVPVHLRDRHYPGAERLGHGEGYEYPHAHQCGYVVQDYLGVPKEYYQPVQSGYEIELAKRLAELRSRKLDKDSTEISS